MGERVLEGSRFDTDRKSMDKTEMWPKLHCFASMIQQASALTHISNHAR